MATRKRTKKYDLNNLVDNFRLVDLSKDELIDDNVLNRESYFSGLEFKNDTNTSDGIQGVRTGLREPVLGISARLANPFLEFQYV